MLVGAMAGVEAALEVIDNDEAENKDDEAAILIFPVIRRGWVADAALAEDTDDEESGVLWAGE